MTELKKVSYKGFTIKGFMDFVIYDINDNKITRVKNLLDAFKLVDYLAKCDDIELYEFDDDDDE